MNKEQLLGRLLMHGHINMDELIILSEDNIGISKALEGAVAEKKRQQLETQSETLQNWVTIFNKSNNLKFNK